MKTLRETYWFFSGQSQWAPDWIDKLPRFFSPDYAGDGRFRWLGLLLMGDGLPGDTLFMAWRRHISVLSNRMRSRFRSHIVLDNDGCAPIPPGFVEVENQPCLPYDEAGLGGSWHNDPVLINAMTPERGLFGDYDPDPPLCVLWMIAPDGYHEFLLEDHEDEVMTFVNMEWLPCGNRNAFASTKDIPAHDVLCPCGNPKHFLVRCKTSEGVALIAGVDRD